jgi:hypothetical protein
LFAVPAVRSSVISKDSPQPLSSQSYITAVFDTALLGLNKIRIFGSAVEEATE